MNSTQNLDELRDRLTSFSINLAFCAGFPIIAYQAWEVFNNGYELSSWSSMVIYACIGIFGILRRSLDYRIRASVSISLIFLTAFFTLSQWGVLTAALVGSLCSSILAIILLGRRTGIQLALLTCGTGLVISFIFSGNIIAPNLESIETWNTISKWWPQIIAGFAFYISLAVTISMIEGSLKRSVELLESQNSELETLNKELLTSTEKAEEASAAKSQFLGIMSHELRTPLNPILGYINLLKDEELSNDSKEYVSAMEASSNHLLHLIDSILKYVGFDSIKQTQNITSIPLADFCIEAIKSIEKTAREKGIKLKFHCHLDPKDLEIEADPQIIDGFLKIILLNALKYTEDGSVELRVSKISKSNNIEFVIIDTGRGISPEAINQVFEPFYQEQAANTRSHEGIGLGLSFAQKMVEALEGTIDVESKVGKGTRVKVSIPNLVQ